MSPPLELRAWRQQHASSLALYGPPWRCGWQHRVELPPPTMTPPVASLPHPSRPPSCRKGGGSCVPMADRASYNRHRELAAVGPTELEMPVVLFPDSFRQCAP